MATAGGARLAASADRLFRPVRSGNVFEEAVERLLQAIRLGVVDDGDRLPPERELAARLRVSRVTLREALSALEDAGLAERRRGRNGGWFVTGRTLAPAVASPAAWSGEELEDTLAFRSVVETGAAELAAERAPSGAALENLEALCQACERAPLERFRQADSRFHLGVAEVAGSGSLLVAIAETRAKVNDFLDAIPLLERNLVHSHRQHRAILRAIADGDRVAARRAMASHLEGTAALLRGFLGPPLANGRSDEYSSKKV